MFLEMLESHPGVSDLNFTVDKPPQVEAYGVLKSTELSSPIKALIPYHTENIVLTTLDCSRT